MVVRQIVIAGLCGAVLAGCGGPSVLGEGQNRGAAPVTSAANDPKLDAAANLVIPELESTFPDTYSGVEMKHADHTMVIYRRSDPKLDELVRSRTPGVTVVFRDAKLSLSRMRGVTEEIMRDRDYWQGQGITINGAGPKTDGSSVEVFTTQGAPDEERDLAARYGEGTVSVRAETPDIPTLIAPTAAPLTLSR